MSHADALKEKLAAGDGEGASEAAKAAFRDPASGEDELAWVAGVVYEAGLTPAFEVLPRFVERFPDSLHIIRAYLANLLERMGRLDEAADEARRYLVTARESTAWTELAEAGMIQDGVAGSFAVLTVVYRKAGARSYALRLLDWALQQSLGETGRETIHKEAAAVREELLDPGAADADRRWELFFSGAGPLEPDLREACLSAGPLLAKRVELIEGRFRFDPVYRPGAEEFLQQVYRADDGAFLLK